jgi:hypothetical protein
MKATTRAKKLNEKIQTITQDRSKGLAIYTLKSDQSTQAELRMRCDWIIRFPVDRLHAPKRLDSTGVPSVALPDNGEWRIVPCDPSDPWRRFFESGVEINNIRKLASGTECKDIQINARTKNGPSQREEAQALFEIECAQAFIAAHKRATAPKRLAAVRIAITGLQARQKEILKEMRAENARYMADRKAAKAAEREADGLALKEGRFWDATQEAIKGYFHPPFAKNRLADVSERWRAALFLECESTAWKAGKGDWRHKLVGTGRAYLCGIDDNGDEWGHRCEIDLGMDDHGNVGLEADVEDAMAALFEIPVHRLGGCERQGDLLFCSTTIPTESRCSNCGEKWEPADFSENYYGKDLCRHCLMVSGGGYERKPPVLQPQDGPWDVRESHRIESDGLERNGRWFRSPNPIHVTHTSHSPVTLEPGEYRLYTLQVGDVD